MPATAGLPQITLKPQKSGTFLSRHPWVLAKSVLPSDAQPADGDIVDLVLPNGRWIARGVYNSRSFIRVRLYSWNADESLDDQFWRQRLEAAVALRQQLGYNDPAGAARLVFSEADGLSGLIVDRYGEHLVVQITALAMGRRLDLIVKILADLVRPRGIIVRTDAKIMQAEGLEPRDGVVWGEPLPAQTEISENGLRFRVDLSEGQKTGYYLDQRENRLAAAAYMRDRRVLDVCCYIGGFGLAAARLGQAKEVIGIDGSEKALEQARANAALNEITNVRYEQADCFKTLEQRQGAGEKFGAIILDPPRFAGNKQAVDAALRAYHRLNRLAVELLEPGGSLVTCSCSGRVTRDDFMHMLAGVAQKTRRNLQILEQRGPSPDHPVMISCPETDYLKCYIVRCL
jgi:23S rRNA (cytosine1962-C5)-methyltransferase